TKDPVAQRERPLINVVWPTPSPSPSPDRARAKEEERERSSRSRSRSGTRSGTRSRSGSRTRDGDDGEPGKESSNPNIAIGPRGEIINLAQEDEPAPAPASPGTEFPSRKTKSAWGLVAAALATKFAVSGSAGGKAGTDKERE